MQHRDRDDHPMHAPPEALPALARAAGVRSADYWPSLLSQIVDVLEAHYRQISRSTDPRGDAETVVAVLAEYFGGLQIYLPKGDNLRRALRDLRIVAEFDGTNYNELARRYCVGIHTVREIIQRGQPKRSRY